MLCLDASNVTGYRHIRPYQAHPLRRAVSLNQTEGQVGKSNLPRYLHLIGVQPVELAIGLELSPAVAAALPEVIRRAAAVLTEWCTT